MHLTDNIVVLGDRHFPIYLLGADRAVILEGGVSSVVPLIKRQVEQLKKPIKIDYTVIMHAHFDHICGIPGLRKLFPEMKVAATEESAKILQRPKIVANFFKEDAALLEAQGDGQNPSDTMPELPPETIKVDRIIKDGEQWQLDGKNINFYQAPGHSYCSIMAYIPEDQVLFCSDSTGFPIDDKRIFPIYFTGYKDYLATIEKMKSFPISILACAHERIIHGEKLVKEYLSLAISEAEKVMSCVVGAWRRGEDQKTISSVLFNKFYTGNLKIYSEQNIKMCCDLLAIRSLQAAGIQL
ncbi:MBL fold metallo-hydrolase [Desulfotruncus alcoholivorax]|uniref:MBL fold metallo-hydrolase n=1 Tax=Desulfotruncus alcoholivorax TaxID=265477 RepID=UPI0004105777|nr:MBL fold metallo-hydrolase [Desulfotruncus alcoholivorax]